LEGNVNDGQQHGFSSKEKATILQDRINAPHTLDVLARQVGILGIFSDWPATVSSYASCMDLK
jgi:hypothetical protein